MQWYYSVGNQQAGPVSQEAFDSLARAGTIRPDTLVWREGMANWAPYATIGDAFASTPALRGSSVAIAGTSRCAECGQYFPTGDMVPYAGSYVCAACKPIFFQKLQEGVATGGAGPWRFKKQLVTGLNPVLPSRCVKCNAPTDTPQVVRKLYWHAPAVYLTILISVFIYVIVALIIRKQSTATVSMCSIHRAKRRNAILTAWALVLGGIGMFVLVITQNQGWYAALGCILFLGGIIYGVVRARIVYATKIDTQQVRLGGCGKDFLAEFPEWTGA